MDTVVAGVACGADVTVSSLDVSILETPSTVDDFEVDSKYSEDVEASDESVAEAACKVTGVGEKMVVLSVPEPSGSSFISNFCVIVTAVIPPASSVWMVG